MVLAFIAVYTTYSEKRRIQDRFETARANSIISSDQIAINTEVEVDTTYVYSHQKIRIQNAERKSETESTAHLTVKIADEEYWDLVYSDGSELMVGVYEGPLHVSKNQEIRGNIEFFNFTCGCEIFAPSIIYYGSLAIGFILTLLGLFLILKKDSNKPQRTIH